MGAGADREGDEAVVGVARRDSKGELPDRATKVRLTLEEKRTLERRLLEWIAWGRHVHDRWTCYWDLYDAGFFHEDRWRVRCHDDPHVYTCGQYPFTVIATRLAALLRRGIITGCDCGCRGDWDIPVRQWE